MMQHFYDDGNVKKNIAADGYFQCIKRLFQFRMFGLKFVAKFLILTLIVVVVVYLNLFCLRRHFGILI